MTNPYLLIVEDRPYSYKFWRKKLLSLDPLTIVANWWLKYSFERLIPKTYREPDRRVDRLTHFDTRNRRVCLFGSSIARERSINEAEEIVNLHLGVLPDYRGCKPEVWAMAEGGAVGVTLHKVVKEIDGGDIIITTGLIRTGLWKSLSALKISSLRGGSRLINGWVNGHHLPPTPNIGGNYYSTPPFSVIRRAMKNLKKGN